jgi:uncharacterized protein YecE (DUF72 family)
MGGRIRIGVGGWNFPPWRETFFPKDVKQKDELAWASRQLTAIEVNGTYYSSQKPATFAKWARATPDGFVFSLKASRFCTNRKILADAGPSIERFVGQGIAELGDRLGPILWQLANSKKFDADDFAGFLDLLPAELDGRPLRHCVEARHASFVDSRFVELCRERGVAICLADHEVYPLIADVTADFVYARLMRGADETPTCYAPTDLDAWAGRLAEFADGGAPEDLPRLSAPAPGRERDVFAFLISGGKPRAPAGAMALIERVGR